MRDSVIFLLTVIGTFAASESLPGQDCGLVTFVEARVVNANRDAIAVVAADFNGDNFPDLVTASNGYCNANGIRDQLELDTTIAFSPRQVYEPGTTPESVYPAGMDGDGHVDLVVANFDSGTVTIHRNNGDGSFEMALSYMAGQGATSVTAANLDGLGGNDLAVAIQSGSRIVILFDRGDLTFSDKLQTLLVGLEPIFVTAADLDGDGAQDLAVANYRSGFGDISLLWNNGDGTFATAVPLDTAFGAISIAVGDLDGVGGPDLAVANDNAKNVSVLLNSADRSFAPAVNYPVGLGLRPGEPNSITAADLDGDGHIDLATANWNSDTVSSLKNNGDGAFAPAVNVFVGDTPTSITSADLDGDGDMDLAVVNQNQNDISILRNTGDFTFCTVKTLAVGFRPYFLTSADFNRDGRPDIAVADRLNTPATISVFLNNEVIPAASRDCNGNGILDECDIDTGILEDTDGDGIPNICEGTRGDCNGKDGVNLSDALFLLSFLFTGGAAPPCPDSCDTDPEPEPLLDLSDALFILRFLFTGGPAPSPSIATCP